MFCLLNFNSIPTMTAAPLASHFDMVPHTLFDAASQAKVAIMIIDAGGTLLWANPQALLKLRYAPEDFGTKSIEQITPIVPSRESFAGFWARALAEGSFSMEANVFDADLKIVGAKGYGVMTQAGTGETVAVLAFEISDTPPMPFPFMEQLSSTEELNLKLRREVEIRGEIEANLKRYAEELKAKNLELEQFAYVASHDLQEPLRMVSSFVQLLKRHYGESLDERGNEFMDYAVSGAERMQALISDLLEYSRVGSSKVKMQPVLLADAITSALNILQNSRGQMNAQIQFASLPTLPGDKTQLIQLFQNLLSNSLKFVRPGITPQITIAAEEQPAHWLIHFSDNGIGISADNNARIFAIFQRLHSQEKYPGTGIGLAIVRRIVHYHGGHVWATANPDGPGTTFHFTLSKLDNDARKSNFGH